MFAEFNHWRFTPWRLLKWWLALMSTTLTMSQHFQKNARWTHPARVPCHLAFGWWPPIPPPGERGLKVMQVPYVKVELLPVEIFWPRALFSHGIGEVGMNDIFLFMLDDPTKIALTLWMWFFLCVASWDMLLTICKSNSSLSRTTSLGKVWFDQWSSSFGLQFAQSRNWIVLMI